MKTGAGRLLAKSIPSTGESSEHVEGAVTLRGHTALVLAAAEELLEHRGSASLRAAGLEQDLLGRLRRLVLLGAAVHDLGKCSDHFQAMIRKERKEPQLLRHEALALWLCWPGQPLAAWLRHAVEDETDLCLALVCAAAHHRKFRKEAVAPRDSGAGIAIDLLVHHEDFGHTLKLVAMKLGLPPPPSFTAPLHVRVSRGHDPDRQLDEWQEDFEQRVPPGSLAARLLPVVKALVLAADVAGSALPRAGERPGWIGQELSRRASAEQMFSIVDRRLEGRALRPFQETIARSQAPLTLARAGCGSGKTVAAYAWAARQHPGRQLWLTYPTTGTATEGFRDYVYGAGLSGRLEHGRAEVDLEIFGLREHGGKPRDGEDGKEPRDWDRLEALRAWGQDVLTCTVDTVLGLIQNQRKGMYAWPALCEACVVFDEIHAYDERLFGSLMRFLEALPGIPVLMMTASLPEARLRALRELCQRVHGVELAEVEGPADLEELPRYRRLHSETPWREVEDCLARGGKVLWVSNTVDRCLEAADEAERRGLPALRYHSRFRYEDRVRRHGEIIGRFGAQGAVLACTTQVAEMSLDLSADLLVTDLAPIPALIQRLGRLNRRSSPARPAAPAPFLVLPFSGKPYEQQELAEAEGWLARLGEGPLSQRDLTVKWAPPPAQAGVALTSSTWLDGHFCTELAPLRESSPSITVLLEEDAEKVRQGRVKVQEVALPMSPPPSSLRGWRSWPVVHFFPVAPREAIRYDPLRGARWQSP
jgi:CRISPR-associated endonuclease/helicase Cas3